MRCHRTEIFEVHPRVEVTAEAAFKQNAPCQNGKTDQTEKIT